MSITERIEKFLINGWDPEKYSRDTYYEIVNHLKEIQSDLLKASESSDISALEYENLKKEYEKELDRIL